MAKEGNLEIDFIREILEKYWKIAIITKDEDKLLTGRSMPKDWDGNNIFARYDIAGIQLITKD